MFIPGCMRTTAPSTIPAKKQFVSKQLCIFKGQRRRKNPVPGPSRSSSLGLPSISTTPPSTLCPSCVRPGGKAHSCPSNAVRTVYEGTARRNNGHDCASSCIRGMRMRCHEEAARMPSAGIFVSRPDKQMQRKAGSRTRTRRRGQRNDGKRREILVNLTAMPALQEKKKIKNKKKIKSNS